MRKDMVYYSGDQGAKQRGGWYQTKYVASHVNGDKKAPGHMGMIFHPPIQWAEIPQVFPFSV